MPAAEPMPTERRRTVEALAQALYEASDPVGVPWVRRPRIVREAWLTLADEQVTKSEQSLMTDRSAAADPSAKGETGCS